MSKIRQLIILGAGPAGISAGIYAKRYGLDFLIIGELMGGTVNEAHLIENYPGFKSISGKDLTSEFEKHLASEIKKEQIKRICQEKESFKVLTQKNEYLAQSLILGLGMKTKKLGIFNEDKFLNRGISYYTPEDISHLKNKTIAVIGGGDSALSAALKLSESAQKVYLIHRRDEFRGAPELVQKAGEKQNIEFILSAQAKEAQGKKTLGKIILDNGQELKIDQLFIEVGGVPNSHLCGELHLEMEGNFIKVDKNQATNLAGLFAIGDITNNPLKQIVTACAEGAIAAFSAFKHLKGIKS